MLVFAGMERPKERFALGGFPGWLDVYCKKWCLIAIRNGAEFFAGFVHNLPVTVLPRPPKEYGSRANPTQRKGNVQEMILVVVFEHWPGALGLDCRCEQ